MGIKNFEKAAKNVGPDALSRFSRLGVERRLYGGTRSVCGKQPGNGRCSNSQSYGCA